jgi:spheroidene monooxygenase
VYGLLVVWENETLANDFLQSSLFNQYVAHSVENYSVFLKPISSRGAWSGFSDWQFSDPNPNSEVIAALTRATLKTKFLFKFWSMVPRVSKEHENFEGLLFTKGVGEIPLMEQATFSVWKNKTCMEKFAMTTFHGEAVMETRRRNGFNEEMFTRLKPYKTTGTWGGKNPLSGYVI